MKCVYAVVFAWLFSLSPSYGQLADGVVAPDFTFTDINGRTQHLYTYLDAGKYVALDISATWCAPCWNYHQGGVMDSLYTLHDTAGDNTWRVLFLEGDGSTGMADLQGTGASTQGDWITGSLFPIMNPSGIALNDFLASYNNNVFPTLYLICPDRRITYSALNGSFRPAVSDWEYAADHLCTSTAVPATSLSAATTIYASADLVTITFSLAAASAISISMYDMQGRQVYLQHAGVMNSGDNTMYCNVAHLAPGTYLCMLTTASGCVRKTISILR